ncbi:aldehyde dehydrogenase family protein [Sneathiella sp. HT1-7]|uniref:aldehyde dehydrogenase family protein n=1 Tax=Sneathiella sp. HT1-7 TaxID=2887192 RepID=UPI0039F07AF5
MAGTMLIGGEWVTSVSGNTQDVINPATAEAFTYVPSANMEDVDKAVAAARMAFRNPKWSQMRPSHRQRALLKLADLLESNIDEFAELESLDNGKPVMMANRVDVRSSIDYLRYIAGWATKMEGRTVDVSFPRPRDGGGYFAYTAQEPVGVVGAIIPWNFPLNMAVWKIGPALATGCTIVLKPASETPLTALRLGELILEAGFPEGVVNIITGSGSVVGAAISSHPDIDKIAFTGSTEVGRAVGIAAMKNITRVSLELGGKSPVLVFDDADLDAAIAGATSAIFFNQGQACTAGSRLYVQRSVFDQVIEGVAARAANMKIGPGLDPTTQMGPLVSQRQRQSVCNYIEKGKKQGAAVLTGGSCPDSPGYFLQPTILTGMPQASDVVQEEIFGPVLVAMPFDEVEEAVSLANDSPYGLASSIWSNDHKKIHRVIPDLQAGTVWVNCHNLLDPNLPFGGNKLSGFGREMGRAVLDLYTETKSVLMAV